ncbi:ZIP-like iron-zinc transporter [Suillus subalutaceus]|uniref:ZIP-like iron-zinc transporter n=1 Tax=Suillus subalutaceus TaxID=48586 RepID=UPI001B87368D|nr:ZIP-like iron-zinc transporter [Suillus subalutaceus]KAG1842171.1 ZIP-like iron-zinc transporter [Suillus subalutaceus]
MSDLNCGSGGGATTYPQLRIASVFVILIGSMSGALFPVLAKRSSWLHVPKAVFDFAKYFGSGVIIATAFIHLLSPAISELSSPCLSPAWLVYPYPLALALLSVFSIFIVELVAFRWGTAKLAALGVRHDAHGHGLGAHAAHGPEGGMPNEDSNSEKTKEDLESAHDHEQLGFAATGQIIGVFILEFGVLLHSMLIGLTLAVDPNFITLFVVIIFHQTFEGLGVGTRLAHLQLPPKYNYIAICGALLYGITTPLGIAVGLGVQSTYNPNSTTASIVSGVLDSLSAGILLYTGLVELLAHEFIFNKEMINGSNKKVAYALSCMLFGCGIMALLGRWA